MAAKLEELLRGVDSLRGWHVEDVGGDSDAGYDSLATVRVPGRVGQTTATAPGGVGGQTPALRWAGRVQPTTRTPWARAALTLTG